MVLLRLEEVLMLVACVTTEGHCVWSVLPPEAMLTSLACAAVEGYDAVRGSCCGRGLS